MKIKIFLLLILLICTIQMRSQTNDPCKWIRPVSWKYVKIHDIKDSSIFTLYGTSNHELLIRKTEDSTNCIFDTDGYDKIYKVKEFHHYTGAPGNELFILPSGNYTFACYPHGVTIEHETWRNLIITTTRKGASYFNENLKPGNYYKIVFVSTDTLLNEVTRNSWNQQPLTYRAELSNIGKEEIIKPSKKYRNFQYTCWSAALIGLAALFLVVY